MPILKRVTLRPGTVFYTDSKDKVEILSLISDVGAEADVYKVSWKGEDYALKWYGQKGKEVVGGIQHRNIVKLMSAGQPAPAFIWPIAIVTETGEQRSGSSFGYLMKLLPQGFYELREYLRYDDDPYARRMDSFHAMIWAGIHFVTAVRALHLKGLSYKDLSPGNLAIHHETGEVLMLDCNNISVDGEKCGVSGTRGYIAPEIVRSGFQRAPTIQSDMYSEAIILFRLFYMDHPMEGRLWANVPLVTERVEDMLYSFQPVFNMHPTDTRNRPDDVYAPNVKKRWNAFPSVLHQPFVNTLVNGVEHINGRTPENAWIAALSQARDQTIFLDEKGQSDWVVHFDRKESIPPRCLRMKASRSEIALYPMQSIFRNSFTGDPRHVRDRIGWVGVSKGNLVMQNCSGEEWQVYYPASGKHYTVKPKQAFRLKEGVQLRFGEGLCVGVIDDPH